MNTDIHSLTIARTDQLLPIGSVVSIEPIGQALMIYGRKQEQSTTNTLWDYVACPYPQGHISEETNVFFNHDQIKELVYKGLETEGEVVFRERLKEIFK